MNRHPVLSMSGLSRRAALGRVAALGAALALGNRLGRAAAQEATPAGNAIPRQGHPLVGAWEVNESDGAPVPISYAVFDADGTWLHLGGGFLSIGVWRPTGERTGEGVEIYQALQSLERLFDLADPVPADALAQQDLKFRFDAEVDAGGNAFRMAGFVVDDQGNDQAGFAGRLAGVRLGPVSATATPAP